MKLWGEDPDERPTLSDRIERVMFAALIAASFIVVLASLFRRA